MAWDALLDEDGFNPDSFSDQMTPEVFLAAKQQVERLARQYNHYIGKNFNDAWVVVFNRRSVGSRGVSKALQN
jgi:hypothetical protein